MTKPRMSRDLLIGLAAGLFIGSALLAGPSASGEEAVESLAPIDSTGLNPSADQALNTDDRPAGFQEKVRGGTVWTPTGLWEAIGTTGGGGCTGTLVSEYAALTAGHCVAEGADWAFNLPNERGTIYGTAKKHPLFNTFAWFAYDYAVIQFPHSIYDDPAVNTDGIVPIPVSAETLSAGDSVSLYGYGGFGGTACSSFQDGQARWARAQIEFVDEDWHYSINSATVGICGGDSGGPLLSADGRSVVGVNSFSDGNGDHMKSSHLAYDWIKENTGPPELPGDTWGQCVYYKDWVSGHWLSVRGNVPSFLAHENNAFSSVWVKKGYKATLYDNTNYSSVLGVFDGLNGTNCNEFGCAYDQRDFLGADNAASSAKCESALPASTWGHCVYYDRYGDGRYYSLRGDLTNFVAVPFFNNRISHLWVTRGRRAEVFPRPNYQTNAFAGNAPRWTSVVYDGVSGDWCNSSGCLHDLVGSVAENSAGSITCR